MNHNHLSRLSGCLAILLACLCGPLQGAVESPLEAKIDQFIKSLRSQGKIQFYERTAWSVYDFESGKKLVSINEDVPLQAASMIKPFVALAFFHRVKERRIIYGPTSRKHMEQMIQVSNNESTNWIMKQVGGPSAVQAVLKKYYPSLCQQISIVEYIPTGGRTYQNRASAGDYSRFLFALWNEQLPYSKEILRIMGLPGRDRLFTDAHSVPDGTQVYNKTGSTAMCCGDMGILCAHGKDGKCYPYTVIGIIETSRKSSSYGTWISARADMIREVSNLVYIEMQRLHSL